MRRTLLVDIGAGALPVVTPVVPIAATWMPVVYSAPKLPTPANLRTTPLVDGVLAEWDGIAIAGATYVLSRAPDVSDAPGAWAVITRSTDTRYTYADSSGEPSWFRVTAELNGRASDPSAAVKGTPGAGAAATLAAIDQEIVDRFNADAAEAAARAQALADEATAREADLAAERAARQIEIAAAQTRIGEIVSDNIISPDEKPRLILDMQALLNERDGILAEAALSEVTTEATAYTAALDALTAYMDTLIAPTRWDDTSGITYLT